MDSKRKNSLVIYFKDELDKRAHGYSAGVVVFPFEIVLNFDEDKNSLSIVTPATIEWDKDIMQIEYKNGMIICISRNKILRIEEK